jgi:hypothetical protein
MKIDVSGENLEIEVYPEELTERVSCFKSKDRRDVPDVDRNWRRGTRCYALSFYLKDLHETPENEEAEGIRRITLWKKDSQELLDLLSKAIKAVKKAR